MKVPLHILHLEDDPDDAALIAATLTGADIASAITCVHNREDFVAALEQGGVDLILSDFALPAFDGLSAIEIVRTRWPHLPVILVSGTLGEERAIDALKSGATDYVLKDRLARLAPAVRRAMQEIETRAAQQRLEAQVIEAQKMEVIGQLAGGVAHDFNNILAVIMGYSDLMMQDLAAEHPVRKYAEEIRHASARAAGLTRQLLVFSRKQTVQPTVLDLNQVVTDADKMLRRLIDENIDLTIQPGPDLWNIRADAGYVGQVLMNLVVNARDALPQGGHITVETRNFTQAEPAPPPTAAMLPGNYVLLAVSDSGPGMTPAVKARLFEPFFTTKPKGKGTGLGLTTCQTIVKQCGGHITVESEVSMGSSFKVYFPCIQQPADIKTDLLARSPLPRGTETLLLVEDEPAVRNLAGNVLAAQGYTVLRASNGQEGLNLAREHRGAAISLVVTDVIMPLMGGKVMADWLQTTYPGLKILFTSGYTDDTLAQAGVLAPDVAFLPKPYTSAVLVRKVRAMLDQPGLPQLAGTVQKTSEFPTA
jgi:two-component system, cell cycle sensor histidine kinase and response regulator CckA